MFWTEIKARPEQIPNDDDDSWTTFLYLAGRGAGKTRTAAEWLAWQAIRQPNTRWAVVAATFGDVRDTCAEGESGLITILRRYEQLKNYNRSMGEIKLTNGSLIKLFSADEPDRLRGPQFHGAWTDELAAWRYGDTWDQLQFTLRLGDKPRTIVTTTPRPTPLIKELTGRTDGSVVVTRGSTFDNAANLPKSALDQLRARYEGTRLGRQELYAELLTDVEGAIFDQDTIDQHRVTELPEMIRIVVAIDPAVTSGPDSDETGIIVVGKGVDQRAYVLADRSCRDSIGGWARRAIACYHEFKADRIVGETNQGGDAWETIIRQIDPLIPYSGVNARRGKLLRAEPVAGLYEQGRVSHYNTLPQLEKQMTEWVPESGTSPDRLDALVHGIAQLGFVHGGAADRFFAQLAPTCESCGRANGSEAAECMHCGKQLRSTKPTPTRPGLPELR